MNKKLAKRLRRGKKTRAIQSRNATHRLVAHRSANHIYAQVIGSQIDGDIVIASCSSKDSEFAKNQNIGNKKDIALEVGKLLAARALKKDVTKVAFDRSGYKYHGRIKALADGAREAGLIF